MIAPDLDGRQTTPLVSTPPAPGASSACEERALSQP